MTKNRLPFMTPAELRQTMRVDANHQLHINVPIEMGDDIEVKP